MSDKNAIHPSSRERLVLLVKNPKKIFVFWQWNKSKIESFTKGDFKENIILKMYCAQERSFASQKVLRWDSLKEYMDISQKGRDYYAVICAETPSGESVQLMESNVISTPEPESDEVKNTYASGFFKKAES